MERIETRAISKITCVVIFSRIFLEAARSEDWCQNVCCVSWRNYKTWVIFYANNAAVWVIMVFRLFVEAQCWCCMSHTATVIDSFHVSATVQQFKTLAQEATCVLKFECCCRQAELLATGKRHSLNSVVIQLLYLSSVSKCLTVQENKRWSSTLENY